MSEAFFILEKKKEERMLKDTFLCKERKEKKKVAIIFGGCSPEYKVSLASAYSVICHMDKSRYEPILIGISSNGAWYQFDGKIEKIGLDTWCNDKDCTLIAVFPERGSHSLLLLGKDGGKRQKVDVVFPVLHGRNGEDGTIQGLFELFDIPVTGCGLLSSALCMDKDRAHKMVFAAGISVPESFCVGLHTDRAEVKERAKRIGYPLFVKPLRAGSSYGVAKVFREAELVVAIDAAFLYDETIIVEQSISGFEVGCAIIGNEELTIGEVDEIELSEGFFDYEEKYTLKNSAIHVPARIPEEMSQKVKRTAAKVYRALGCKGFARVDFFLSTTGEIIFNEVNTIPGFTEHSRFPTMLKAIGMGFMEVISAIIELACEGNGGRRDGD